MAKQFITAGWGFDIGQDFDCAIIDIPCRVAPSEYAKPGHVIAYIAADPESRVGFLRGPKGGEIRVHVLKRAIGEQP